MTQTLAEKSYRHIREKLSRGELPPGERLVNRTLAAEIGVSVIPVREAIHRLASEGLVEHRPGSGAFVRTTDPQQLDNLYVLREAIESCAAGEAARYIQEHQLADLEAILTTAEQIAARIGERPRGHATKRQMSAWVETEKQFHSLLLDASRNPLLSKVAHDYRAVGEIFDAHLNDPELLTAEVAERTCWGKRDLLQALRERDPHRARQLMSQQIERGRRQVVSHLRNRSS